MHQHHEIQWMSLGDDTLFDRYGAILFAYIRAHTATREDAEDLTLLGNPHPTHLPNLQAKKWLVRFMCSASASTAALSFNGQQFSAPHCDQRPISKVITFDSPQSFQTLKVTIRGYDLWLLAIETCTNEQTCQADSN